jgi:PadR family transcriptional regulator PadR
MRQGNILHEPPQKDVEYLHPSHMAGAERYQNRIELLQGTLDMLILQTLRWGPQHGYGITQAIRTGSNEAFQLETGSLYPALHRLEKKGWVKAEWKTSENKQRAKYYQLTPEGKKQLASEHTRWKQLVDAVTALMKPQRGRT